jgi:hypothetical protein
LRAPSTEDLLHDALRKLSEEQRYSRALLDRFNAMQMRFNEAMIELATIKAAAGQQQQSTTTTSSTASTTERQPPPPLLHTSATSSVSSSDGAESDALRNSSAVAVAVTVKEEKRSSTNTNTSTTWLDKGIKSE